MYHEARVRGRRTFAIDAVIALEVESAGDLASGRFLDTNGDGKIDHRDEQQIWLSGELGHQMVDRSGLLQTAALPFREHGAGRVADLVPDAPGDEYLMLTFPMGHDSFASWSSFGGAGPLDEVSIDLVEGYAEPWLADLRGDGTVQFVTTDSIRDARSGELVGRLEGVPRDGTRATHVSADLDRDGVQEVIAFHPQHGVRFYRPNGTLRARCGDEGGDSWVRFAVGNLDDDPEGEVVVARRAFVEVCDSDGTQLARERTDLRLPSQVGLGEFDADLAPEIVIAGDGGLRVLDDDLSELFSLEVVEFPAFNSGFSLADLDGDGFHEILVGKNEDERHWLVALSGSGDEVASVELPSPVNTQPIVADFDADGLAEIAVSSATEVVFVIDGAIGGWDVPDADHVWSGVNRFPGDRTASGEIPSGGPPHWSTAETNVWQGLPTVEHPHFGRRDRVIWRW